MEQRQLNFAEKSVQVLTLEELEKSYHENLTTGEPVGGIYHFALIQEVLEMFEKRGLKPDRMDIPQVLPQSLALFETLKEMIK